MPKINEFLTSKKIEKEILKNNRIEKIEGDRPCTHCDLNVESYYFNQETFEMFWTCSDGHENKFKVG